MKICGLEETLKMELSDRPIQKMAGNEAEAASEKIEQKVSMKWP